jgi:hypothetical protein
MYHIPVAVAGGMVTVVEAELLVAAPSAGTSRLPIKTSEASRVVLVER